MSKSTNYEVAPVVNIAKKAGEDGSPLATFLCVEGCCVEGGVLYSIHSFTICTTLFFHTLLLIQCSAG